MLYVHQCLLEAIATVQLYYGDPSPLERIFELAESIRQRLEREHPSTEESHFVDLS
jgi:hypothetical protein